MRVAKRWEGYRMTLDRKRRDVFDHLLYEMAGRREETLVNHPDQNEAAMMNMLIEMELRLREVESRVNK
jgi:predicted component of type VI protein secretion system